MRHGPRHPRRHRHHRHGRPGDPNQQHQGQRGPRDPRQTPIPTSGPTSPVAGVADLSEGGGGFVRQAAQNYLAVHRTEVKDAAYPLAVAAYALSLIPGAQGDMEATLDLLMALAKTNDAGIYWEPYPVETTAYAALALLNAGRLEATPAVEYLASQRGAMGGYGSTQATVMAFQALTRAALIAQRKVQGTLSLLVGDELFHTFHVNADNYDLLQTIAVPVAEQGALRMEGTGKVGYQVATHFNLPGEEVPPPRNMLIQVDYQTDHVAVDELVDVVVTLQYPGPREETNMVIADVGVPTGFEVEADSLTALEEAGTVSRIEVAVRKVIFYIPKLYQDTPLSFTFQVRALFLIQAAPVPSVAYDYYVPEDKGIDPGTGISVGSAEYIRGDANRDGVLDISDAVAILGHLFGGAGMPCRDAADTNDDGAVNIADPVYLLSHLFAGGPPPPEPWQEPGTDPTEDDLGCSG